ncbi:MAG TPA: DNA recombination protein RmuC [Steroidobacteraceae bacterium]|jgi:DNA recombination protein RmuC|nr:DNA recombination protein RmuC [Steroidobacteraceae bacterium]
MLLLTLLLAALLISGAALLLQHLGRLALQRRLDELLSATQQSAQSLSSVHEVRDLLLRAAGDTAELQGRLAAMTQAQHHLGGQLSELHTNHALVLKSAIDSGLRALNESLGQTRSELALTLKSGTEAVGMKLEELRTVIDGKLGQIHASAAGSAQLLNDTARGTIATVTERLGEMRTTLDAVLKSELGTLRAENASKLETIRQTVDEKLHATLEQRLGESFRLVSERLESVHRGLGEMQSLASGVGDLRRVLTNIKTRGTWGEVQLEALLDQVLTAEQYARNVCTRPDSAVRVDFAIRLPGRSEEGTVWLPMDAKFPMEDYQRLLEAQERADVGAVEDAGKALELRIKAEAHSLREKYVAPPHTTEFAILYLPIEGLYAEVLRRPGLVEWVQRECRVVLAGPTTLLALLNSLQMGFRTLAIEKRSAEVWSVLGAVKTEFLKFGEALAHTKKKLDEASNSIESAERRNRVLTRKLKGVDALPAADSAPLLPEPTTLEVAVQE